MRFTAAVSWMLLTSILSSHTVATDLRITRVQKQPDTVRLQWDAVPDPVLAQSSRDLREWSDQGDLVEEDEITLSAPGGSAFYRLHSLHAESGLGRRFGFIQTEQGEFGALMGRHRLKSRMWLYTTPGSPHDSSEYVPLEYWRKLRLMFQQHVDGRVQTWNGLIEELGTLSTSGSQRMLLKWTNASSSGGSRRFTLTLQFPYSLQQARTVPARVSDPTYELTCTYSLPQPELDFSETRFGETLTDTVDLVELDPQNPNQGWPVRRYRVSAKGVRVDLHYLEGLPLFQGAPPWIFKTLLLDRWLSPTTAGGGQLPAFSTDSYFARTHLPGHHNFYEIVLLEPELDPALPTNIRGALRAANIRFIYTFKDLAGVSIGGETDVIRYFGYDGSIHAP